MPKPLDGVENVLFLFTDQQRKDSLGVYGNEFVDTPNLDRLAADGAAHERAYTPTAICAPARSALVTGELPHNNGVTRNPEEAGSFPEDCRYYTQLLRDTGYEVGLTGKWHLGTDPAAFGVDGPHYTGWWQSLDHDDYLSYLDERDLPRFDGELHDTFPESHPEFQSGGVDDRPIEASFTYYLAERAIERLRGYAEGERPFYHGLHFFGPHNPYYLPAEYLHKYDPDEMVLPESAIRETFEDKPAAHKAQRIDVLPTDDWRRIIAAYHGWVAFIDDQVGRVLDELDRLGLTEETAVVFTSDHGGFVSAHKSHDKGPAMYEDIYNVPLITRNLGQADRNDEEFVSLLDLPPTFLDLAGVEVPDRYDGRSLLEIDAEDWREDIVAEFHGHKFAYEQRMLRTDRYKFVLNQSDTAELYDLQEDPHELDNRIDDPEYGEIVAELYQRLLDRLDETDDEPPATVETHLSAVKDVWEPEG